MDNFRFRFFSALLFSLLMAGFSSGLFAATTNIAFILDGPFADLGVDESPISTLIKSELQELMTGSAKVSFPSSEEYMGDWTRETLGVLFEKALNDKNVDMIVANGMIASRVALSRGSLSKPVFLPVVIEPSANFM